MNGALRMAPEQNHGSELLLFVSQILCHGAKREQVHVYVQIWWNQIRLQLTCYIDFQLWTLWLWCSQVWQQFVLRACSAMLRLSTSINSAVKLSRTSKLRGAQIKKLAILLVQIWVVVYIICILLGSSFSH